MLSTATALAWEIWRRHRLGLASVAILVAGFGILAAIEPLSPNVASAYSLWFMIGICYVIGVFAYGFEAKLESPESGFPRGSLSCRFALARSLVRRWYKEYSSRWCSGWAGTTSFSTPVESRRRRGGPRCSPRRWRLCQALVWLPFGIPWLRLFSLIVLLSAIICAPAILVLFGDRYANPETQNATLFAIALGLIPIAFLIADLGVKWARRGDTPVWFGLGRANRMAPAARPRREVRAFASALQAQTWYEWRTRGRGFVVTVVLIVLVIMGIGLLEHASQRTDIGLVFLLVPLLIASFWGSQMGSAGTSIRSTAIPAFIATRPLDNTDLATAKRRAATRTSIATWAIVLALTPGWFAFNDGYNRMTPVWERAVERSSVHVARGFCLGKTLSGHVFDRSTALYMTGVMRL